MKIVCVAVLLVGTLCYAQSVESDEAKLRTLASAMKSWSEMSASSAGYLVQRHLHKDAPHFIDGSGALKKVCEKPTVAPTHPPKMPGGLPVVIVQRVKEMFAKLQKVLQEKLCKVVKIVYSSNRAYPVIAKLAGCKDSKMDAILELGDVVLASKKHTSTKESLCKFAIANSKTLEHGAAKATAAFLPFLRVGPVLPSKPAKKANAKNLKTGAAKAVADIVPFLRVGTVVKPEKKKAEAKKLQSAAAKAAVKAIAPFLRVGPVMPSKPAKKAEAKKFQSAAAKAAVKAIAPFLRVGPVMPSKPVKKAVKAAARAKADLKKLKSFLPYIRVGTVVSGDKPAKKASAKDGKSSAAKVGGNVFVQSAGVRPAKPSKPVRKASTPLKAQPKPIAKPIKDEMVDMEEPKIADETGFGSNLQTAHTAFGGDSDSFENDDASALHNNGSHHGNGSHHHRRRHHRHHHRHHHLLSRKVRIVMFYSGTAILGMALVTILARSFAACRRTKVIQAQHSKFGSNNYAALVDAEDDIPPSYAPTHGVTAPTAV